MHNVWLLQKTGKTWNPQGMLRVVIQKIFSKPSVLTYVHLEVDRFYTKVSKIILQKKSSKNSKKG